MSWRDWAKAVPGAVPAVRAARRGWRTLRLRALGAERAFEDIYRRNAWGESESVSGAGSTLAYTAGLRGPLAELLAELGVAKLLDAPCGDYNWFARVARPAGMSYLGADIVAELVERNQDAHGDERTSFRSLDIRCDPLPEAELWLCRDCLFHFSYSDVGRALDNFVRGPIPWILTSSYHRCERNVDIATGDFRELNLGLPPLNLPPPERALDDWIDGMPPRVLGLWSREALAHRPWAAG